MTKIGVREARKKLCFSGYKQSAKFFQEKLQMSEICSNFAPLFREEKLLSMPQPNVHITGLLDCIQKMQSFVPSLVNEADKQQFIALLSAMQGYTISASNELAISEYRIDQLYKDHNESVIRPQSIAVDIDPINTSFFYTERFTSDIIEKNLRQAINIACSKADACRRIMALETCGYIVLSNVNDARKAELVNPFAAPKYVFTGDDFKKARNNPIKLKRA